MNTATKKEFVLGSSDVTWDFTTTEFTGDRIDNELNSLMFNTYELARKHHLYVACDARLELQGFTDSSLIVTTWTIHAHVYTVEGEHLKDIWATSKHHKRATELVLQRLDNFIDGYRTGKPVPKRVVNALAKVEAEHAAAQATATDELNDWSE